MNVFDVHSHFVGTEDGASVYMLPYYNPKVIYHDPGRKVNIRSIGKIGDMIFASSLPRYKQMSVLQKGCHLLWEV